MTVKWILVTLGFTIWSLLFQRFRDLKKFEKHWSKCQSFFRATKNFRPPQSRHVYNFSSKKKCVDEFACFLHVQVRNRCHALMMWCNNYIETDFSYNEVIESVNCLLIIKTHKYFAWKQKVSWKGVCVCSKKK